LLGVDITGQVDCELLRYGISGREALLRKLKEESIQTAKMLAQRFGINMPAAITTIKPSGDSAVLFGCSSGVHPRYARFYRRWVRESKDSPMCKFLVSQGVPYAPAPEAPERLMVFCFPVKSPEGVLTRNDLSAIQQLENWLAWRENYTEHSVSCTVYVGDNEWDEVGEWVWNHMDSITGVSFLPRDNGTYKYAPNEEITEDEYMDIMRQFPKIDWSKLREFDQPVNAQSIFTCSAGSCSF
jgi:ribonucleoside-diphosphate reductase alpha chain